jgi:hypothetical protein
VSRLNEPQATPFSQTFFHGTKADLKIGDFVEVGFNSNYGRRVVLAFDDFTSVGVSLVALIAGRG